MPEMLLLGAGASVEAGIPASYTMTERIMEDARSETEGSQLSRVISFVAGGLLFQKGIQGDNPLKGGVNVEELFSAVQLLAERHSLEAAPFVGSWHAMVDEFDKVVPPLPDVRRLHKAIYQSVTERIVEALKSHPSSFVGRDIDDKLQTVIKKTIEASIAQRSAYIWQSDTLSKAIGDYIEAFTHAWLDKLRNVPSPSLEFERELKKVIDQQPKPSGGRRLEGVAEWMIRDLANIVWLDDSDRVHYLLPIVRLVHEQKSVVIASLNYDNAIEMLAARNAVPCHTAIDEWSRSGDFRHDGEGILLLKLHGSIDWEAREAESEPQIMPHTRVVQMPEDQVKDGGRRPAVVFGERNKLTAHGPFLDLLRAFRQELDKADRLTVIGYSFRDDHINLCLSQWLNQDKGRRLRVINRSFAASDAPYARELRSRCSDRLEVIAEDAGAGLRQAFGE